MQQRYKIIIGVSVFLVITGAAFIYWKKISKDAVYVSPKKPVDEVNSKSANKGMRNK